MPDLWAGLLTIGLFAGVLSGMFGIGGGVIIVPTLAVFMAFETVEAISTSLAALLLPVGVFAVIAYYRAGLLELRSSILIATGLLTTSWLGAEITLALPSDTLRRIYGIFLLYIGWRFTTPRQLIRQWQTPQQINTTTQSNEMTASPDIPWYIVLLVGLVAGIASGMFGIGGGAVIVPSLVAFLRYDQKLAVGTSLGALLLPVGLPGVLRYADEGVLDIGAASMVAFGLMIGAIFGARIALNLPSTTVKRLYGIFLFFVALRFILQ